MLMMLALRPGIHSHWCGKGAADADDAGFEPGRLMLMMLASDGDDAGFGPWHS